MRRIWLSAIPPLATLALVASTGTVGCGFVFTHGPPQDHKQLDYFTCTEGNTGPILDIVFGGLNLAATVFMLADDPDSYGDSGAIVASGLTWTAFSGAAAGVGFSKTSKCRDAKRELAARQAGSTVESQGAYSDMPWWAHASWNSTGIALPRIGAVARQIP